MVISLVQDIIDYWTGDAVILNANKILLFSLLPDSN